MGPLGYLVVASQRTYWTCDMRIENLSRPGELPTPGDLVTIHHTESVRETKILPPPPPEVPVSRWISAAEYRDRFTLEEKRALYTLAKTVLDVQIWLDDFNSPRTSVDLERERQTLLPVVAAGALSATRAMELTSLGE